MSDETDSIVDAGRRMDVFATSNTGLIAALPLAVEVFGDLRATTGEIEQAGASRSSAVSAGRSGTRNKADVYADIYDTLRTISQTAAIIEKRKPGFENKFTLPRDRMTYQQTLERGLAMHADSAASEADFSAYGLPADFRAELLEDIEEFGDHGRGQTDARQSSVGDTANIESLVERFMDDRDTANRMMKNLFRNNPAKLAEWQSAHHIERRKKRASQEEETVK